MDKMLLVESHLAEGRKLLDALDEAGLNISAALWAYDSANESWSYIVATPLVHEKGPKAAYEAIQAVLLRSPTKFSIELSDIAALDPEDSWIVRLKTYVKNPPIPPKALDLSFLNVYGEYVSEGIIYRV